MFQGVDARGSTTVTPWPAPSRRGRLPRRLAERGLGSVVTTLLTLRIFGDGTGDAAVQGRAFREPTSLTMGGR